MGVRRAGWGFFRKDGVRLLLMVFLAGAGWASPLSAAPKDSVDAMFRGMVALSKGDDPAAMHAFLAALKSDPANDEARFRVAMLNLRHGRYREAEWQFTRLAKNGIHPDETPALLAATLLAEGKYREVLASPPCAAAPDCRAEMLSLQVQARLALGDRAGAEKDAAAAQQAAPKSPAALLARARVLTARGEAAGAEALVDEALRDDPKLQGALVYKAELRRQAGDAAGAIDSCRRALAVAPHDTRLRFDLVIDLLNAGRDAEAGAELDMLLAAIPTRDDSAGMVGSDDSGPGDGGPGDSGEDIAARESARLNAVPRETVLGVYLKSILLVRAGDMPAALEAIRSVEALVVTMIPKSSYVLAVIHAGNGNPEQAILYAGKYHRLYPQAMAGTRLLSRLYFASANYIDVIRVLEPLRATLHGDVEELRMLGASLLAEGRFDSASQVLAEALKGRPEDVMTRAQFALSLTGTRATREDGIRQLEHLVSLPDGPQQVGLALVATLLSNGDHARAIEAATGMAERQPSSPLPPALRGVVEARLGEDEAARRDLESAIAKDPDYAAAVVALAGLEILDGETARARERLDDFLRRRPANLAVLLARAGMELRSGARAAAEPFLQTAIAAHPESLEARMKLVELRIADGALGPAADMIQGLVRQYPADLVVNDLAAALYLKLGRADEAVQLFRELCSRAPDASELSHRLGRLLVAAGRHDEALPQFARSVADDPGSLPAWVDYAFEERAVHGLAAALDIARKAAVHNPKNPEASLLRGDLLRVAGELDKAEQAYQDEQSRHPSMQGAYRLVLVRQQRGNRQAALATARAWLQDHPRDIPLRLQLAQGEAAAGNLAAAIAQYEAVAGQNGRDASVLNNLALVYDRAGDGRAIDTARRAFRLAPDNPSIIDSYAYMLLRKGDRRRGGELLRQAYAINPGMPSIAFHLAVALAREHDAQGARKILEPLVNGPASFGDWEKARRLYADPSSDAD